MIEASTNDRIPRLSPRTRRIIRRLAIGLAIVAAIFYLGGGWYFSTQLGNDAFVVDTSDESSFEIEVVQISDEEVTMRVPEGDEPTLDTDGVYALDHGAGRLELGAVVGAVTEDGFDVVTRQYRVVTGAPPEVGDFGDLDSFVFASDPSDLGLTFESVEFETELGTMDAWLVPGIGNRWVILVHGKGASRRETLRMMQSLEPLGMPMLAITYRNDPGQPGDPSGYYRYGVTEWSDLDAAVDYARTAGADDVVLAGFSTGAALSLGFMYQSDHADAAAGIIFDAPNIDFGRTVDYGASQRTLPLIGTRVPQSLTTVAKFIGALRFGVDWSELDYIDHIDQVDVPMLVFHGREDTTVPFDVSERLREDRSDLVELHLVEEAEHVQSWNVDPGVYAAEVVEFMQTLGE